MDITRLACLTRSLAMRLSRRTMTGTLGLGMAGLPGLAEARKKRRKHKKRKKKQKVTRNDFGCVDVGAFCQNSDQCCSGICEGNQEKKTCQAHDGGSGCQAGQAEGCLGVSGTCMTSSGLEGNCDTTTGNAAYCGHGFKCMDCRQDVECQDRCGQAAAVCITCPDCDGTGTLQTACVGPGSLQCN